MLLGHGATLKEMDLCNQARIEMREPLVPSEDAAIVQGEGVQATPNKPKYTSYSQTVLFGVVFRKDLFVPIIILEILALCYLMPVIGSSYTNVIKHGAWPPSEVVVLVALHAVFFMLSYYLVVHLSVHPLVRVVGISDSKALDELREGWWQTEHKPSPYWHHVDEMWTKYYRIKEILEFFESSKAFKIMKKQAEKEEEKACNEKSSSSQSDSLLT